MNDLVSVLRQRHTKDSLCGYDKAAILSSAAHTANERKHNNSKH